MAYVFLRSGLLLWKMTSGMMKLVFYLRSSHFLKKFLKNYVQKAEAIILWQITATQISWKKIIWKSPGMIMPDRMESILIDKAGLIEKPL